MPKSEYHIFVHCVHIIRSQNVLNSAENKIFSLESIKNCLRMKTLKFSYKIWILIFCFLKKSKWNRKTWISKKKFCTKFDILSSLIPIFVDLWKAIWIRKYVFYCRMSACTSTHNVVIKPYITLLNIFISL